MLRSIFMLGLLWLQARSCQAAEGALPPCADAYLEGAVWQDLRLLVSFAMGIACVHTGEVLRDNGSSAATMFQRKHFELYPFVL
mmetsp:Transcript_125308/g.297419  ORF Transcript_125308/g.297419 Transcript_125308/m.297419 type:complete len:84 (-) Transcript_125308:169-420(-)